MKNILIKNTEIASYFLWEYSNHFNAIDLWYCIENICYYFEEKSILSIVDFERLSKSPRYGIIYINFVRNIAYRIYLLTKNEDDIFNWYVTERLLANAEWCHAVVTIASIYRNIRENKDEDLSAGLIKTNWIRKQL